MKAYRGKKVGSREAGIANAGCSGEIAFPGGDVYTISGFETRKPYEMMKFKDFPDRGQEISINGLPFRVESLEQSLGGYGTTPGTTLYIVKPLGEDKKKAEIVIEKMVGEGLSGKVQGILNTFAWDEDRRKLSLVEVEDQVREEFGLAFTDPNCHKFSESRFLAVKFLGARLDLTQDEEFFYARLVGDYGQAAKDADEKDRVRIELEEFKISVQQDLSFVELAQMWLEQSSYPMACLAIPEFEKAGIEIPFHQGFLLNHVVARGYLRWTAINHLSCVEGSYVEGAKGVVVKFIKGEYGDEDLKLIREFLIERLIHDVKAIRAGVSASPFVAPVWGIIPLGGEEVK